MTPDRIRTAILGSSLRDTGAVIVIASSLTIVMTGIFLGIHWWGTTTEVGVWILTSAPPQFGRWSPAWFRRLWFGVIIAGCVISIGLGMRHAESGGGLVGTTALVGVVPLAAVCYHRVLQEYHEVFWPEILHDMRPTWTTLTQYLEWWTYLGFAIVVLVVFVYARWLSRRARKLRRMGTLLGGLWIGVFFAFVLRWFVQDGALYVPRLQYLARDPMWHWAWRMVVEDLPFLAEGVWYATVAAVLGWLLVSGYRWIGQIRGPGTSSG